MCHYSGDVDCIFFPNAKECYTSLSSMWVAVCLNMDKIVISSEEVAQTGVVADAPLRLESKLPPTVPVWAKWVLSPLVLFLPLLCLVAIVLRVAMRTLPPRNRHAWTALLATLLIVSGLITSAATVVIFSIAPLPPLTEIGLSVLDEKNEFPNLPTAG